MVEIDITIALQNIEKVKKFDIKKWIVSKWTRSKYFHIKILINNTWIDIPLSGVTLYDKSQDNFENPEFDYFSLGKSYLLESQYDILQKFIQSIEGQKYDWTQIFLTHFIRLNIDHKSKWTCSELVTKLLQMCYYEKAMDLRPERVTPKDIARIIKDE